VLEVLMQQQSRGALARQEYVSLLPVVLLGQVSDQERVLDMCASPGSKASQLLNLHPSFCGLFVANEFDRRRLGRLNHRLQKECAYERISVS
jgi:16S rRNA C967 or C1407 C5-methylase (RsmB/RsmF family)